MKQYEAEVTVFSINVKPDHITWLEQYFPSIEQFQMSQELLEEYLRIACIQPVPQSAKEK